jgi:hypothetical protein
MTEPSLWTSMAPVVVGGAIGIMGTLASSTLLDKTRRKAERKSLTGAFVGEISALIEVSDRRGYLQHLHKLIAAAKADPNPNSVRSFHFSNRRNPFAVYDANLTRLGILRDPLPQLITRFYTQASSALEDVADMREGKFLPRNRDASIQRLQNLLELLEDTRASGCQVIAAATSGHNGRWSPPPPS